MKFLLHRRRPELAPPAVTINGQQAATLRTAYDIALDGQSPAMERATFAALTKAETARSFQRAGKFRAQRARRRARGRRRALLAVLATGVGLYVAGAATVAAVWLVIGR